MKLLVNIVAFGAIVFISVMVIVKLADNSLDNFYGHFISGRKSSLILGTSRAAQGLIPEIINKKVGNAEFYNFSFTLANSPYGKTYYEAIRKKIIPSKSSTFLLAIDPWSISEDLCKNTDTNHLKEQDYTLQYPVFDQNPNVIYLTNKFSGRFVDLFSGAKDSRTQLTTDGWLRVDISMDENDIARRKKQKLEQYNRKVMCSVLLQQRIEYFEKTVSYLKSLGEVYLVRMPVCQEILDVEIATFPDFENYIQGFRRKATIPYFDFKLHSNDFVYTDGNHLAPSSSVIISQMIGDSIASYRKSKDRF
jgi:hypothetical protein